MTEQEWLACGDPVKLLDHLHGTTNASDRKFRLTACACVRSVSYLWDHQVHRQLVELAEQYADGLVTWDEVDLRNHRWNTVHEESVTAKDGFITAQAWLQERVCRDYYAAKRELVYDIFGNPFRPVSVSHGWLSGTVVALARTIYAEHAFRVLPILADAL